MKKYMTTVFFLIVGLLSLIGTTFAWFTIADRGRVSSMSIEITNGANLYFDVEPHEDIDDYFKVISLERLSSKTKQLYGYELSKNVLHPVTTKNGKIFTNENGEKVEANSGYYIEIPLNFISTNDMYVHLTTENEKGMSNGTLVNSDNEKLIKTLRISFEADGENSIYNPSMSEGTSEFNGMKVFGLNKFDQMVYSENNSLFYLRSFENKEVIMRIWIEGTDEYCTNDLKGSTFSLRLRFAGTDKENSLIF